MGTACDAPSWACAHAIGALLDTTLNAGRGAGQALAGADAARAGVDEVAVEDVEGVRGGWGVVGCG